MLGFRRYWPLAAILAAVLTLQLRVLLHLIPGLHDRIHVFDLYNYVTLTLNYGDNGPLIRRGVAGTLFRPFLSWPRDEAFMAYHAIVSLWAAAPLLVIAAKTSRLEWREQLWALIVLVASPQLFLSWCRDIGRADLIAVGFIAWAFIAAQAGRYLVCALIIFAGALAHETALFFAGPVCLAMGFLSYRRGETSISRGALALGLLLVLLIADVGAQQLWGPTMSQQAQAMISHGLTGDEQRYPIYATLAGFRNLVTSACMSFARPSGYMNVASVFVAAVLYGVVFMPRSRLSAGVLAFSVLLPLAVVSIIAIDYGRWLSFAIFSGWLAFVGLRLNAVDPAPTTWRAYLPAAVVLVLLMAAGPANIDNANMATTFVENRLWPSSRVTIGAYVDTCDPGWRSVIPGT